ncbi:MAG: beta galactosidase jelly roll domain-containing protein [Bacteroidales bacterium]|nr:beta galactosidase jelly roll domain-containing protein [Bacteroidales bacterium]
MKTINLIFAFLIFFVAADAQTMMNVSSRKTKSLNGIWKNIVDPYGHWYHFWDDEPFTGKVLQDYDFDSSDDIKVPGDWNTQNDKYYFYEGSMWYRTKFNYSLTPGNRLFVNFGAVNYKCTVWVNGKEIGNHEGGYTGFEFDITDAIKSGEDNSLVLKVNNQRQKDGIPSMSTDWWNYGGITRDVNLVEVAPTFVYDYSVQINKNNFKLINAWVQLKGKDVANQEVTIQIPELKINKKAVTDITGKAVFEIKASPKLWTPYEPKLYDVTIKFGSDILKDEIGFRTIKTNGSKILLNGKEIFLCGVNLHEETVGDSKRANTREQDSVLLMMAKDMSCNFVRLAHYPHNEQMTKMADKIGLMVWSEIPLYWGINWNSELTYNLANQQLTEMITRDRNRASIIIWSIANETAVQPERTQFLTRLANDARKLDDSRLISAALQNVNKQLSHNVYTIEDPLHEALDLFSFNEYIGWYDNTKYAADSITWVLPKDKPIVISEFGAGGVYGRHSGKDSYFSEDNMAEVYKHQFVMLGKIEGLSGTMPWVLKDFRSPLRKLKGIQDDFNRKGLYSDKGQKKMAWSVLKEWNEKHQ